MFYRSFLLLVAGFSFWLAPATAKDSPPLEKAGSEFLYSKLKLGDSREVILQKLRDEGFVQIYEERNNGLVKCTVRWNGFRYELTCRMVDGKLALCLIEGQKGWHPSFFSEEVFPQWKNLRNRLIKSFGEKRKSTDFPEYSDVPLDDLGGKVTDSWELEDRLMVLAVRSFMVKDCCTEELLEYSCCTLLIQPKK